jgi:arylsulfatase A-like enzyme
MTPNPDRDRSPNIVYIMADDLGYGDLGCYGATLIPTPHIDRLAAAGVRLTDAHSSSAVCTPSRYSVLTGRYCWRTPLKRWVLWGFEPPLIEPERLTVAGMLRARGYATAAIGKWHLGLGWRTVNGRPPEGDGSNVDYAAPITGGPLERGFDTCFSITGSLDMAPYCFIKDDHVVIQPTREKHPYHPQQRKGLMSPDWDDAAVDATFGREAVAFIDRHMAATPERPFFLYLTPSAPHRPCVPPDFIRGASQAGQRGDMVALVDWMVGQVDEALQRHGIADDTLIIVTSDNGARLLDFDGVDYGHRPNGNLRGQKADIWDGGHREPFIARWPGRIPAGSASDELACLADLMATCADIVGYELPASAAPDSYSLLPALLGQQRDAPLREALVHHSGDGLFSIRRGPWKLIVGLGSGGFSEPVHAEPQPGGPMGQLYHLDDDLVESENLWLQRPDVVGELTALLTRYQQQGYSRPGAAE